MESSVRFIVKLSGRKGTLCEGVFIRAGLNSSYLAKNALKLSQNSRNDSTKIAFQRVKIAFHKLKY